MDGEGVRAAETGGGGEISDVTDGASSAAAIGMGEVRKSGWLAAAEEGAGGEIGWIAAAEAGGADTAGISAGSASGAEGEGVSVSCS